MIEPPRNNVLTALAPGFAVMLTLALADIYDAGIPAFVFEGSRSDTRQGWLHSQGRSRPGNRVTNAASALYSWHGYGLAADLAMWDGEGWNWPPGDDIVWDQIAKIVARHKLVSGATWNMDDNPHIQPANLKTSPSEEARRLFRAGGRREVWRATGWDKPYFVMARP